MGKASFLLYSLPALAFAIPSVPAFVLLPVFYAEDLGLGLAVTGWAFFIIRLVDMISDPVVGWMTSSQHRLWGRRKLWIIGGAILGGVALWSLFVPPEGAGVNYLLFWGSTLFIGWTIVQIPYLAWGLDLTPTYHQKTRLAGYREGATLIGILGALTLPLLLGTENDRKALESIALITLIVGAVGLFVAMAFVEERRRDATIRFKFSVQKIVANKLLLRTLTAWFLNGIGNGLPAVCFALYATYVLQVSDSQRNLLLLVYFLSAIVSVPVWMWVSSRVGKSQAWCGAIMLACVSFSGALFLGQGDFVPFLIVCLLTGIALGADTILPPAIQADVLDWDRWRFRRRIETIAFSFWTLSAKFALALAAVLAFPVLEALGLQAGEVQGLIALKVIYALLPIVFKAMVITMMWSFPLSMNRHKAIEKRLTQYDEDR